LFLFILVVFILPIGVMLFYSIHDDTVVSLMPKTTAALRAWDGKVLPDEQAYAALVEDLKEGWKTKTISEVGKRMNYELPGARSRALSTPRRAPKLTVGPYRQAMIAIDPIWGQQAAWAILERGGSAYTLYYLLRSLDYQYDAASRIVPSPASNAIFQDIFIRT